MNKKKVVRLLNQLIDEVKALLPRENIEDALVLMNAGEWSEVHSLICTQLYEYEVAVPEELWSLVQRSGEMLGISTDEWGFLSELRKGGKKV